MIILANAEAAGYAVAGFIYIKNGGRARGIMSTTLLAMALLTSITFAVHDVVDSQTKSVFVAMLIMLIRFLMSVTFNSLLLSTFSGFPTIYLCTVLGMLNFLSRLCGLIGPSHDESYLAGAKIGLIVSSVASAAVCWKGFKE